MAARNGKTRNGIGRGRGDTLVSSTDDITQLDCNCVRSGGAIGQEVYCARHRRIAVIICAAPEWTVACIGCTWTKREGLARVTAEVDAARHARRRQHRVQVFHGARLAEEFGPRAPGQMALFRDGQPPGA